MFVAGNYQSGCPGYSPRFFRCDCKSQRTLFPRPIQLRGEPLCGLPSLFTYLGTYPPKFSPSMQVREGTLLLLRLLRLRSGGHEARPGYGRSKNGRRNAPGIPASSVASLARWTPARESKWASVVRVADLHQAGHFCSAPNCFVGPASEPFVGKRPFGQALSWVVDREVAER